MDLDTVAGIDSERVTPWFADHVTAAVPPLTFSLVAGGRSNPTYRVEDAAGHLFALRRPPTGHVLPTAHDMAREHRILQALWPTSVPVPRPLGLCQDPSVNGSDFYVMSFVEGPILRDATTGADLLPERARPAVGTNLADTLAALHAVDVDAVGLGDLARRDGYVQRQLRRWTAQYSESAAAGVVRPGSVESVGEALAARVPLQHGATIVHGDYRLDNVVLHGDGSVAAVLDWELCTLGDPLADVGTFLDYWTLPADGEPVLGRVPASALPGFASADDVATRYAATSGRDITDVAFYRAFGYWRLACILQGVFARYRGGAPSGDPESVEHFPGTIARLADLARDLLERGVSPGEPGRDGQRYEVHATPVLDSPVLIVAMEGWVDAGLGAANAATALIEYSPATDLVTFDSDHFIDMRARRPIVRIVDGVTTELQWPRTQIRYGHDQAGADVLFLVGPEPDYDWGGFVESVVQLVLRYGVRLVVGLGAFPAPAPHTRPVRLAATAPSSSAELVTRFGVVQGELEVPAGVLSALELGLGDLQVPTVSLWARVPHYVSAMSFPMASAALVEGLAEVSGLILDTVALRAAADAARRQVDDLIAGNPEHVAMVRKLEEAIDASEGNPLGIEQVPSADELAAELERFLRGEER